MRVLIVFCEGPHDVFFAARSLERNGGYQRYNGPASGLPTPFGWQAQDALDKQEGLVLSQVRRLDPLEIDLDRLNFGKKPLFELATRSSDGSHWALFVNMGSDSASAEVIALVKRIRASQLKPGMATQDLALAFLFDADFSADGRGREWRIAKFKADYQVYLGLPDVIEHGAWLKPAGNPVGLWVHWATTSDDGTLEDHAGPLFSAHPEWKPLMEAAQGYVDAHGPDGAPVRAKRDKRMKAAITIAGQVRPNANGKGTVAGSGMNVMIQRALDDAAFDAEICKQLASFLTSVPWNGA